MANLTMKPSSTSVNMTEYMSFVDSVRKHFIVPVLTDGYNISIYRFSFTDETQRLFDDLIEVRQIEEHTNLVGIPPYYSESNNKLGTLVGKHELNIESFKKFYGLDSEEVVKNYVRKHLLPGEEFDSYYSRVSSCLKVEYCPSSNENVQSFLSIVFKYFCEYPDFDALYRAISLYLSGDKSKYFNEKELGVDDKSGLVIELLKSLDVEELYSTDVSEENGYVLSRLFDIDFDDFGEQSKTFILEYSKYNHDMLFDSNLSYLFSGVMPLSKGRSKKK